MVFFTSSFLKNSKFLRSFSTASGQTRQACWPRYSVFFEKKLRICTVQYYSIQELSFFYESTELSPFNIEVKTICLLHVPGHVTTPFAGKFSCNFENLWKHLEKEAVVSYIIKYFQPGFSPLFWSRRKAKPYFSFDCRFPPEVPGNSPPPHAFSFFGAFT